MKWGRIILLGYLGSLLVSCQQEAPALPNLKKNAEAYDSTKTPGIILPVDVTPKEGTLPTAEEIKVEPITSGFRLYSYYCQRCHDPVEVSKKRGRIPDAAYINSRHLATAGYHAVTNGRWPTVEQANPIYTVLMSDVNELLAILKIEEAARLAKAQREAELKAALEAQLKSEQED